MSPLQSERKATMWICERHDKITYLVSHTTRPGAGSITRITRNRWQVESDDTGATATCPTLTKAFFWVQNQSEISVARRGHPVEPDQKKIEGCP